MKPALTALLGLSLVMFSVADVHAATDQALRKEFRALYDRQSELIRSRDAHGLMAFNLPEHSVKTLDGKTISRADLEAGMMQFFASGQLVRQIAFDFKVLELTAEDSDAVVLVEQRDKRIQLRKDGKPHRIEATVVHRDHWKRTVDGWKRYLTEEVKQVRFTVDGKPPALKKP